MVAQGDMLVTAPEISIRKMPRALSRLAGEIVSAMRADVADPAVDRPADDEASPCADYAREGRDDALPRLQNHLHLWEPKAR